MEMKVKGSSLLVGNNVIVELIEQNNEINGSSYLRTGTRTISI